MWDRVHEALVKYGISEEMLNPERRVQLGTYSVPLFSPILEYIFQSFDWKGTNIFRRPDQLFPPRHMTLLVLHLID